MTGRKSFEAWRLDDNSTWGDAILVAVLWWATLMVAGALVWPVVAVIWGLLS